MNAKPELASINEPRPASQPLVPVKEQTGERVALAAEFRALGHGVDPMIAFGRTKDWFRLSGDG